MIVSPGASTEIIAASGEIHQKIADTVGQEAGHYIVLHFIEAAQNDTAKEIEYKGKGIHHGKVEEREENRRDENL